MDKIQNKDLDLLVKNNYQQHYSNLEKFFELLGFKLVLEDKKILVYDLEEN